MFVLLNAPTRSLWGAIIGAMVYIAIGAIRTYSDSERERGDKSIILAFIITAIIGAMVGAILTAIFGIIVGSVFTTIIGLIA